jgi:uncharacterized protein
LNYPLLKDRISYMETLLEYLITDFHDRQLPELTPRQVKLPQIKGKIDTVIGMRRAGKTYFLYQVMQALLNKSIDKKHLLYLNFADERLLPMRTEQLRFITETYYRVYPELKNEKCYFFFDEIQNITGWELFIRRLLDTENIQIALTGSSSTLLSKEISTNLRGRAIATEIFPFSFQEMLIHQNPKIQFTPHPGAQTRALMANRIQKYIVQGGFPEAQTEDLEYRINLLQEYVDVVLLKDVLERYKVTNVQALRAMVRHILANPATLFSVNKFYDDLRSQGISCTKDTLYDYLDYLQDTYLIYPISISNRSERVRRTNPRKIYMIDTGLINAFLHQPQSDWGHLLENFVYMELRRKGLNISYYRTKDNREVDFISTSNRGERILYQVALSLKDNDTRQREILGLTEAMKECGLKRASIITLDEQESIKIKEGIIEVIPAWKWAISFLPFSS